jgi:hypothetical protein
MKSNSDAILNSANELGIDHRCRRGQMAGSGFAIDRQQATERELNSASVTPGSDGIGERRGLCAALESEATKSVGHDAFAKSGVDGTENKIGVGRPDQVRRALVESGRLRRKRGDSQPAASSNPDEWRAHTQGEAPDRSGNWGCVIECSIELDSAGHLGQ